MITIIAWFADAAIAQVPSNRTVFDCSSNSKNIYTTLSTGKSLIVLHKGVDCSICRSAAPGWQTWAAANTTNVEMWGALTYTYSGSAFPLSNSCTLTNNWVTTYGWNDIFTFPDSNRLWVQAASPRYYVYSAIDSTIVYQSPNSAIARSTAIAQSTVGINRTILRNAKVFSYNGQLFLKNLPEDIRTLTVLTINGQVVLEKAIQMNQENMDVSEFKRGTYILKFTSPKGIESKKLIF